MNKNDFKPFAAANNANVTTQSEWENLSVLLSGFVSGKASSGQINKALRQATVMACVLAQYISDTKDTDVLDDGDISGLVQKLKDSINSIARVTSVNDKTGAVTLGASDVDAVSASGGGTFQGNVRFDGLDYLIKRSLITTLLMAVTQRSACVFWGMEASEVMICFMKKSVSLPPGDFYCLRQQLMQYRYEARWLYCFPTRYGKLCYLS
jgi:hypothetical protein